MYRKEITTGNYRAVLDSLELAVRYRAENNAGGVLDPSAESGHVGSGRLLPWHTGIMTVGSSVRNLCVRVGRNDGITRIFTVSRVPAEGIYCLFDKRTGQTYYRRIFYFRKETVRRF